MHRNDTEVDTDTAEVPGTELDAEQAMMAAEQTEVDTEQAVMAAEQTEVDTEQAVMAAEQTEVLTAEAMKWAQMPNHVALYHRELVSAAQADRLNIRLSSILWERIGVGGCVLPHYHDVAEIIHITTGQVKLLCNGQWESYKAGDTFHVPAGVVHSVANEGQEPSEQISIFVPMATVSEQAEAPAAATVAEQAARPAQAKLGNRFFQTTLVEAGELPACVQHG